MTIYYVDTFNGNDANDGSSWGQAWKSTAALWTIYAGMTTVTDVEVRIAKTPVAYSFQPNIYSADLSYGAFVSTVSNPGWITTANHMPICGPIGMYWYTRWADGAGQGSTMVAPFTADTVYQTGYGSGFSKCNATAGATGNVCYWPKSNLNLTGFYCLEFWAYHNGNGTVALTLDLCSDAGGTTVLRSYPVEITNDYSLVNITVAGAGDLPSGINSVYLRVTQNTCSASFGIYLTRVTAVTNPTASTYRGDRAVLMPPANHPGMPMSLIGVTSDGPILSGIDSPLYTSNTGVSRQFDAYCWAKVASIPATAAFAAATTAAGTPAAPIKIIGGYNTGTGVVDGLSCVDQAIVGIMPCNSTGTITLVAENLIIANYRRSSSTNISGVFQKGNASGYPLPVSCSFKKVHIPCPTGPASSLQNFRYPYSVGMLLVDMVNTVPGCYVTDECMTYGAPIVGNQVVALNAEFKNGRISQGFHVVDALVENTIFWELRFCRDNVNSTTGHKGLFRNCSFYMASIQNTYGGNYTYVNGLKSDTEDCFFYGQDTGPCSSAYYHKNPKLQLYTGSETYPWGTIPGTIDNLTFLSVVRPLAGYFIFSYTYGAYGPAVFKNMNNLNLGTGGLMKTADGTTITMQDCSFVTSGNTTGLLSSYSTNNNGLITFTNSQNISLSGDAPYFCNSGVKGSIDNLNIGASKLARWTPVGADNWWGVGFSATNFQTSLATKDLAPGYDGGSFRLVTTAGVPIWFAAKLIVEKDTSTYSVGPFSWKFTLKAPIGYIGACKYRLGTLQVKAGVELQISCKVKRSSTKVRPGILIYCGATMEWTLYGVAPVLSRTDLVAYSDATPGVWDTVILNYTPTNAGLITVMLGAIGEEGYPFWFDTFKASQNG